MNKIKRQTSRENRNPQDGQRPNFLNMKSSFKFIRKKANNLIGKWAAFRKNKYRWPIIFWNYVHLTPNQIIIIIPLGWNLGPWAVSYAIVSLYIGQHLRGLIFVISNSTEHSQTKYPLLRVLCSGILIQHSSAGRAGINSVFLYVSWGGRIVLGVDQDG